MAKHYIDQELVRKAGQRLRQIRESRQLSQDIVDMDIDVIAAVSSAAARI
ncbi:MAG: hypothetical protein LUF87_03860 [Alistipes sp.]|nr:hypothetical protein [Alistipes sp.]